MAKLPRSDNTPKLPIKEGDLVHWHDHKWTVKQLCDHGQAVLERREGRDPVTVFGAELKDCVPAKKGKG